MHRGPSPNAMMWSVHQAHEVVTKLSRLLTPTVLMFCTAMAVNASNWVVYVALPRQHVDVNPRFTQFLGVSVQIALATWSLHGAANCSAACDELHTCFKRENMASAWTVTISSPGFSIVWPKQCASQILV